MTINIIAISDLLTFLFIFTTVVFIFANWRKHFGRDPKITLIFLLSIMLFHYFSNVMEWLNIEKRLDPIEDFIQVLEPLLWIFFFYSILQGIAEKNLYESKERFRSLVETTSDFVWETNNKGVYTYVSPKIKDLLGYEVIEVIGKTLFAYMNTIESKRISKMFNEVTRTRIPIICWESENIHKDGRVIILETNGVPFFDNEANFIGYRGIDRDITERKNAEKILEKEKEQLSVTLKSIGDGVISTDRSSRIILMNRIAEDLTGFRNEEAVGKDLTEVFCNVDEHSRNVCNNPVEKVLKTGKIVRNTKDTILISRDGKEHSISESGAPIKDKRGETIGVVLVFRDITGKKKMEEEVGKIQKLEMVGVLAGGIAHDFNNLLTAIIGNINLSQMNSSEKNKSYEFLRLAEEASLKAKGLTQQLLSFAKGGTIVKKTGSIQSLLKETVVFLLRGTNIAYEFNFSNDLKPLDFDEGQLNQAFNNLVINARESMKQGGTIKLSAENVKISASDHLKLAKGDYVLISVEDEGEGISPENVKKVFDPYYSTKQEGHGLGLTSVFSIVQKHDGYITVESEKGKGTKFYIYLPVSEEILDKEKRNKKEIKKGKGRILVMDDDEYVGKTAGKMLEYIGYEVKLVSEGNDAINLFRKEMKKGKKFDAILLDLTVPGGKGGKEAMSEILKIDPKVKAIVASGYSSDPVMSNYKDYGFSGVIKKPYEIEELSDELNKIMKK